MINDRNINKIFGETRLGTLVIIVTVILYTYHGNFQFHIFFLILESV